MRIPVGGTYRLVDLLYLAVYDGPDARVGSLAFLHKVRVDPLVRSYPEAIEQYERAYELDLPKYTRAFAELLHRVHPDVLVCAPSRRNDGEPYRAVAKDMFPDARDLSAHFTKASGARAALSPSFADLFEQISFVGDVTLGDSSGVLIIDESISAGMTAGIILSRLEEAGLPPAASVTIAAPLLIQKEPKGNSAMEYGPED